MTERFKNRRTYIVRMDFQVGFIIRFCVLVIVAAIIVSGIVYGACQTTLTTVFDHGRLRILSTSDFIMPYLVLSSLIAIGIATAACWWMTLIVSNRLAGPIFRLEKDIARVGQGDLTVRFRVRKKDELQSLARILDQMTQDIHEDLRVLKQEVARIDLLDDAVQNKQTLDRVRGFLEKYKV